MIEYKSKKIRAFKTQENELWFVGKDICNVLDLKNSRAAMSNLKESEFRFFEIKTSGGRQSIKCLNEKGIKKLLNKSRKLEAINFANKIGINVNTTLFPNEEQEILSIITAAFKNFQHENQLEVGSYRLDLYFPELKIAVECDEFDHENYNAAEEIKRQLYIERELGCYFVRFNPDEPNFNVGDVINQILMKVLEIG